MTPMIPIGSERYHWDYWAIFVLVPGQVQVQVLSLWWEQEQVLTLVWEQEQVLTLEWEQVQIRVLVLEQEQARMLPLEQAQVLEQVAAFPQI
ncbi:MAG: hypothetical protein ACOYL3_03785 [Desulfuromonadaceae bacterium]